MEFELFPLRKGFLNYKHVVFNRYQKISGVVHIIRKAIRINRRKPFSKYCIIHAAPRPAILCDLGLLYQKKIQWN